jgi:hypothetical protein
MGSECLLEHACVTCVAIITKELHCTKTDLNCCCVHLVMVGACWDCHCRFEDDASCVYPSVTAACAALSVVSTALPGQGCVTSMAGVDNVVELVAGV